MFVSLVPKPVVRVGLICGFCVALLLAGLWLTGGMAQAQHWVFEAQKAAQSSLAASLRALRAGRPGAWGGWLAICFGYGFLHAAGPGHGKMVIGGFGIARRVAVVPLVGIAVAASLAQALVAVVLVLAGVLVLGWGRDQLQWANDTVVAPLGTLLIAGLGVWIMLRGMGHVGAVWRVAGHERHDHHDHAHGQDHDGQDHDGHHGHGHHDHGHDHAGHVHDEHCGHVHGPSVEQVAALTGWRDTAALIVAIALRPCTGALFVLILTQLMGIGLAGVIGAFTMGLGTAMVTALVAVMAVWTREGALASLPGAGIARALPYVEVAAGAAIVVAALLLWGHSA